MSIVSRSTASFHLGFAICLSWLGATSSANADSPLLSSPKVAPKTHQPDVMVSKGLRKRPVGDNIYLPNYSPRETLVRGSRPSVVSFFRVQNETRRINAPANSIFLVRSDSFSKGSTATYLNSKGKNITAQLARGRYVLNLPASAERIILQKLSTPKGTKPDETFGIKAKHRGTGRSDAAQVKLKKP